MIDSPTALSDANDDQDTDYEDLDSIEVYDLENEDELTEKELQSYSCLNG